MAKKKHRKMNKKKPNSLTWRNKADDMWKAVIHQVGKCEICGRTTSLNAHHIITRKRLRFRHDVSNGVCLCSYCHQFSPDVSPHADSFSAESFLLWLKINRTGQYAWYEENKDNKRPPDKTYEQAYYELKEIYEKGLN